MLIAQLDILGNKYVQIDIEYKFLKYGNPLQLE